MLISLHHVPNKKILVGEMIVSVSVVASHVLKDIRENIRNLTGGDMINYEKLIETATTKALEKLEKKAKDEGYDGAIGVTLSHPHLVDGGVEIIAYGNCFRYESPIEPN